MKEIEKHKAEDKNPIDILDEIAEVKNKISFLATAITQILVGNRYSNEVICGLQALMFSLEDDLNKITSALNKKFNLPSDNERKQL